MEQRAALLESACSGNAELRRRVEALLRSHEGRPAIFWKHLLTPRRQMLNHKLSLVRSQAITSVVTN
jgi:hypothetical protein